MADFGVDGIRMDSVNNVANWDFVEEFKDLARQTWPTAGGAYDAFLVVREELSVPLGLLRQNRLDGLWNEDFKRMVRIAVMVRNDDEARLVKLRTLSEALAVNDTDFIHADFNDGKRVLI